MEKKLQRDENNKMIGGVAAGLAEYFDIDVTWVRVGFILAVLAGLSGIVAYAILWIAVPARPLAPYNFTADYKVGEQPTTATDFMPYMDANKAKKKNSGRVIGGAILIFMGLYFLIAQFGLIPYWFSIHKLWPLALIVPGILMLSKASKSSATNRYAEPVPPAAQPEQVNPSPNHSENQ